MHLISPKNSELTVAANNDVYNTVDKNNRNGSSATNIKQNNRIEAENDNQVDSGMRERNKKKKKSSKKQALPDDFLNENIDDIVEERSKRDRRSKHKKQRKEQTYNTTT